MASIPVSVEEDYGAREEGGQGHFIRVIVADSQAIFRAGLRKTCSRTSRNTRANSFSSEEVLSRRSAT